MILKANYCNISMNNCNKIHYGKSNRGLSIFSLRNFGGYKLGAVHKIRPQSGGLSSIDNLWTRGVFQMRTSTLFGANASDFLKFMVCPHGQGGRGWASHTFCGQGSRGNFFAILCEHLLWTVPYYDHNLCREENFGGINLLSAG